MVAGLKREPLETRRLVIGDPKVAALPGDRGQPIAEVGLRIKGAALIEHEGDFAGRFFRPRPSAHRGSPHRLPCCGSAIGTALIRGGRFLISAPTPHPNIIHRAGK
jgi:hypothetical protein